MIANFAFSLLAESAAILRAAPWTFGRLGKIIVSPSMHRWHHARDPEAHGTNFATVFALYDRLFGTFRVPGLCTAPLGVDEPMGSGVTRQLAYPLRLAAYAVSVQAPAPTPPVWAHAAAGRPAAGARRAGPKALFFGVRGR